MFVIASDQMSNQIMLVVKICNKVTIVTREMEVKYSSRRILHPQLIPSAAYMDQNRKYRYK